MERFWIFTTAFAIALMGIGCVSEEGHSIASGAPVTKHSRKTSSPLVARVDGVPITADEVSSMMAEVDEGITARDALDVLVRHQLLAAEARRRGMAERPETKAVEKAARARAVLNQLVREAITVDTIDEEVVRQYYETHRRRFVRGEMRRVVHFVALTRRNRQTDSAARALAERVFRAVGDVEDAAAFRKTANRMVGNNSSVGKVETLPAFDRESKQFVEPFVKAVFEIRAVGDVSRPFKTEFGWHVAYLDEETPAMNRPYEAVRQTLVEELVPKLRKEAAGRLMTRLLEEGDPFVYEGTLNGWSVSP
jgi:hypothetical protein